MLYNIKNKFKKMIALSLIPLFVSYSSLSCIYKTIPIETRIGEVTREEFKEEKVKYQTSYSIKKINFNERDKTLDIVINKDKYENTVALENLVIEDKYEMRKNKEICYGYTMALWGGISTVAGIGMALGGAFEKIDEGGVEVYKNSDLAVSSVAMIVGGLLVLLVGFVAPDCRIKTIGASYYELRNPRSENIEKVIGSKLINTVPANNVPIELSSYYFLFDGKNSIKINTNKEGIAKTKVETKNENFTFTREDLYNLQIVQDLKSLGLEEKVKEVIESANKVKYPLTIKIDDESKNIVLKGYEISGSKIEELIK